MFYLVEGLNCAGKTTWIQNQADVTDLIIRTTWANPLRWDGRKFKIVGDNTEFYALGVYDTIIQMYCKQNNVYWDRTFIPAYVYKSISRKIYDYLVEMLYQSEIKSEIIFMDTPIDVTLERWYKLKKQDPDYKNYAWANNKADAIRVQHTFYRLLGQLQKIGFTVRVVSIY